MHLTGKPVSLKIAGHFPGDLVAGHRDMQKSILVTILPAIFIVFVGMGIIVPILPIYAAELGAN